MNYMKKYTSIIPLVLVLAAIVTVLSSCKKKEKPDEFTFAFITDIHLQPEGDAVKGFRKVIDTLNSLNPDFVITGGDLIMDALSQSHGRADSLYRLYTENARSLKMPVHNTMGNHEIYGIYKESGADPSGPDYGEKMFENKLGESYYSFNHKGWKFMVLNSVEDAGNSSYEGLIDQKQLEWIRDEINNTDPGTPVVLSTHIPFITVETQVYQGTTVANDSSLVIYNGKEVLDLFKGHNLKIVLQGHLHIYEDILINGTHFITGSAVAGGWWRGPYLGHEEGFILIRVKGSEFSSEFVDYNWIVNQKQTAD